MTSKVIATNHKAYHNYFIQEGMEAGIALTGSEIKSIRAGRVNLGDAYVKPDKGEMWLLNAHIARYEAGAMNNHEPLRDRKLLLHRRQIRELVSKTQEKGLTLVPTRLYFKDDRVKVEIALAKGKKLYDKRETIAKRESERELGRLLKTARQKR